MAEKLLHGPDVVGAFEQVAGKGIAERTVPAPAGKATASVTGARLTSSV